MKAEQLAMNAQCIFHWNLEEVANPYTAAGFGNVEPHRLRGLFSSEMFNADVWRPSDKEVTRLHEPDPTGRGMEGEESCDPSTGGL